MYRPICHKCRSRLFKKHHPESYFFNLLRVNARRRGKEFLLTIQEFRKFCADTGYLDKKGKNGSSLSIDRINVNKPYSLENIQALTLSENSSKRNHVDYPF